MTPNRSPTRPSPDRRSRIPRSPIPPRTEHASALAFGPLWLALGELRVAAAVSAALLSSSAVATTIGLALPCRLARSGADPASGSGPLATVAQDARPLVIHSGIVSRWVL